jgi:hypothetical protein
LLPLFWICRFTPSALRDDYFQPPIAPPRIWSHYGRRLTTIVLILLTAFTLLSERASSQPLSSNKDKFLGCSTNSTPSRFMPRYWNQVTPGNDGKCPVKQWLRTYVYSPLPPTPAVPFAQIGNRNPLLVWQSAATATSYHVQVSAFTTFNSFLVDTTVTDTTLRLAPLAAGTRYFWRVSGLNQYEKAIIPPPQRLSQEI